MPTNPPTTLETIQVKVRKLTRSPVELLSDADLNNYINTFVAYDMPDHLRMFDNKVVFSFICEPYRDTYMTDASVNIANPLYDFQNKYISIDGPLYIAGYTSYLSQSREEFYNQWPLYTSQLRAATGNSVATSFSGTLSATPVLRNQVVFSSIDANNNGLALLDDGAGNLTDPLSGVGSGTIDYVSGVYSLTFGTAPGNGQAIQAQVKNYIASRPTSLLYFDNMFTLRPVPDRPYKITFSAYMRPTALLAGQNPQLQDWWQYIAYGAAKKVFEDRMDQESVQAIMTEFDTQQRLVERKTLTNMAKERAATIYQDQTAFYGNVSPFNNGFY